MCFIISFIRGVVDFVTFTVDGAVAEWLGVITETSLEMVAELGVVVTISPVFILPGIVLATLGAWVGELYMKTQLSVKRERSNAKAPVLGHFGAAFAGISTSRDVAPFCGSAHRTCSFHSCIWSPRHVQEAVICPHQPVYPGLPHVLLRQSVRYRALVHHAGTYPP